jgi:predicted SprT family Zn-dependent metalloprotease
MDNVKRKVTFLINRANKIKGTKMGVPHIRIFKHSFAAAVAAKVDGVYTIYINEEVYKHGKEFLFNEILPHEVAHIILFRKNEPRHTKEWKTLCKALGGTGNIKVTAPIQLFGRAIHYNYRGEQNVPIWVNRKHHKLIQSSDKEWAFSDRHPLTFIRKDQFTGLTTKGNPYEQKKKFRKVD